MLSILCYGLHRRPHKMNFTGMATGLGKIRGSWKVHCFLCTGLIIFSPTAKSVGYPSSLICLNTVLTLLFFWGRWVTNSCFGTQSKATNMHQFLPVYWKIWINDQIWDLEQSNQYSLIFTHLLANLDKGRMRSSHLKRLENT